MYVYACVCLFLCGSVSCLADWHCFSVCLFYFELRILTLWQFTIHMSIVYRTRPIYSRLLLLFLYFAYIFSLTLSFSTNCHPAKRFFSIWNTFLFYFLVLTFFRRLSSSATFCCTGVKCCCINSSWDIWKLLSAQISRNFSSIAPILRPLYPFSIKTAPFTGNLGISQSNIWL